MIRLKEICKMVNGELQGDADFPIESVNSLDKAGEKEITFSIKDTIDPGKVKAGALIVKRNSPVLYPNLIYVDEP